jgi:hypothetical protein
MEIDEAARVFTDPKAYADEKRFHVACGRLRRQSPVALANQTSETRRL